MMKNLKTAFTGIFIFLLSMGLFSQETRIENNIEIPLTLDTPLEIDESALNLENSKQGQQSNLQMGLYITTSSETKFLTRDIATGSKKGFELDSNTLYSKGNWWFWGDLGKGRVLDAEIALWDGTTTLYQANSYAGNVDDTTLIDGVQNLSSNLFAPLYGFNDNESPNFNKFAFSYTGNYLSTKVGYGNLGTNTMSTYEGIFTTLESWEDVSRGYTEFSNGSSIKRLSNNLKLDLLLGLSRARSSYGVYSLADLNYKDFISGSALFGSTTSSEQLFLYDQNMKNALSILLNYNPTQIVGIKLHGIYSFDESLNSDYTTSSAAGIGANLKLNNYNLGLELSIGGEDVESVWGDDTTLPVNSILGKSTQEIRLIDLKIGLNNIASLTDYSDGFNGLLEINNQLIITYALDNLINKSLTVSVYGGYNFVRTEKATDPQQDIIHKIGEIGLQLQSNDLTVRYALSNEYLEEDIDKLYNSISVEGKISDNITSTLASLIRVNCGDDDNTFVPMAFALGLEYQSKFENIGSPEFFINGVWGMDPYEDDGKSLIMAEDDDFTTNRLEDLNSEITESKIRFGIKWNL